VHCYCRWFEQSTLLIAEFVRKPKELLFMEKHLLAPAATNGLRPGKYSLLTKIIIACGTGAAGRIYTCGETVRAILQDYAVSNLQILHVITYFDDLTYDLVSRIEMLVSRESGWGNTKICICKNEMEIAAADAC